MQDILIFRVNGGKWHIPMTKKSDGTLHICRMFQNIGVQKGKLVALTHPGSTKIVETRWVARDAQPPSSMICKICSGPSNGLYYVEREDALAAGIGAKVHDGLSIMRTSGSCCVCQNKSVMKIVSGDSTIEVCGGCLELSVDTAKKCRPGIAITIAK